MNDEWLDKYIVGEATENEKRQVVEWLMESEENRRKCILRRRLFEMTLWQQGNFEQSEKRGNIVHKRLRMWIREIAKVAAVAIVGLVLACWWFQTHPDAEENRFQSVWTPAGQRTELLLADGTKVWLNAHSRLTFPVRFGKSERRVQLDGEGYFEVTHDTRRPFFVETSRYDVKVLGTEFNVLAYATDSVWETSLLKGRVEVLASGKVDGGLVLEPDTRARLCGQKLQKDWIRDEEHFLWREGLVSFKGIAVGELMKKLELYYDIDIVVNNERILRSYYSGKFRVSDGVEHVLRVLQLNLDFSYERDDENNRITIN